MNVVFFTQSLVGNYITIPDYTNSQQVRFSDTPNLSLELRCNEDSVFFTPVTELALYESRYGIFTYEKELYLALPWYDGIEKDYEEIKEIEEHMPASWIANWLREK